MIINELTNPTNIQIFMVWFWTQLLDYQAVQNTRGHKNLNISWVSI
jgi:hypothetical protein